MTPPDPIHELRALLAKATPGPWTLDPSKEWIVQTAHLTRDVWIIPKTTADIEFIAAARNALPAILERVERAERENRELSDALTARDPSHGADGIDRHLRAVMVAASHVETCGHAHGAVDRHCLLCLSFGFDRIARMNRANVEARAEAAEAALAKAEAERDRVRAAAMDLRQAAVNYCADRGCEGDTPDGSCADYTPHDLCAPCELSAACVRFDAQMRGEG